MNETSQITLAEEGRRLYIVGNSYPIKDQIKSAGGHWDADRKQWWIGSGKRSEIEAAITTQSTQASESQTRDAEVMVCGKAKYKGRSYYVRWSGVTKRGTYAFRLVTLDGKSDFWANGREFGPALIDEATWEKRYQESRSLSGIRAYIDRVRSAEKSSSYGDAGWMHNGCSECKRLGDWCKRCAFDEFDN